ncbi:ABC transporter ATP-binding protein [Desulfovibrio sp. OttesenSCG-928-C14]|nr:ABC transporter ATP-binding protein [Desulfovibrio sp. OttesenSCG-928-C14]
MPLAEEQSGGATCLELIGISKSFAGKKALRDVSLKLLPGEFTVILGPSGCGKSTLLNIIAGITGPDSAPEPGQVIFRGRDITNVPMEKRNFGMVFQNYALFPNLSVYENIAYGLRAARASRAAVAARVKEMLELVRLPELARSLPGELSGGQQQRVALARALAPRPDLLLLDEPLSALDARVREALGQELLQIQREAGITAIMVTHDQQEALALADRIVLLREGRVEQRDLPEGIYSRPASRFAAEFIGHTNFLTLPEADGGRSFGIRFEDVRVAQPTEAALRRPFTQVGKVLRNTHMGAFSRLEILLNDFSTRIFADLPWNGEAGQIKAGALVAVGLPEEHWLLWEERS